MTKAIDYFIKAFLLLIVSSSCFCQTETFDIATYTAPKDWKKDAGNGITAYSIVNESTGGFCLLAMYPSSASLGDAQKDFKTEWKKLVATPHKVTLTPKTAMETSPDGWKVVSAAVPIKLDSMDAYSILSVFSGFGKKFSVLSTLNDQSYINGIDSFMASIQLDKTGNVVPKETTTPDVANSNETKGQFGTLVYSAPQGWKVSKFPDGDILVPADLPKGQLLEIWVQPAMNFSGTIEQALQKSYNETSAKLNATVMRDVNGGNYSAQAAKKSYKGWEYIRCSGGIHMGGGDYPPEYGLDVFLVKVSGRFEQVAIIKSRNNCGMSRYYSADQLNYYYAIENFLYSMQFPDWKEPDIKKGSTKGEGIIGCWQGISLSVGAPKPGTILGVELKGKQLIFFSNGQAFFGNNFPAEGLDELNTWMRAELNRRDWGTYSFANGKGVLKLPYADIPLRMEKGKFIITTSKTDHEFVKGNTVDGARFNGSYALSSKNMAGEETGHTPVIRFTTDGKFTDDGAMAILFHEYNTCINLGKAPGSGTYEVKNHSVIFNYSDGRKIKIAFIGTDYDKNNTSPATITLSFNEDMLKRQ